MKRLIAISLLGFCFSSIAFSQTKDISGSVINEKNEHIIGATIKVKGSSLVAFSDDNGMFVLKGVPDTAVIVASAVGYQDVEISVADKAKFTITLIRDSKELVGSMIYPKNRSCSVVKKSQLLVHIFVKAPYWNAFCLL